MKINHEEKFKKHMLLRNILIASVIPILAYCGFRIAKNRNGARKHES